MGTAAATAREGSSNYFGNRFSVYDFEKNDPANKLEPFSDAGSLQTPNGAEINAELTASRLAGERLAAKAAAEAAAKKITECTALHAAYKALACTGCKSCTTKAQVEAKITCLMAEIAGRGLYLRNKCDNVLAGSIARGSATAEAGHQTQLLEKSAALANCYAKLATLP